MEKFPDDIQFCYAWRSYQERVLAELDQHLRNKHLHLVAPPGSGKTVLGLEVMLRLNEPTFIVAPTLTIRNQWAVRFTELFLQADKRPNWISTDIRRPAFITITTYQSLHSLFRKNADTDNEEVMEEMTDETIEIENEEPITDAEKVFEPWREIGFKTFILDEAHHLRTAWWKSTIKFRNTLENPTTIALTATPPYDVGLNEWNRYIELCGPIDAEITIPELVRESELCPHQDYVLASLPSVKEAGPIDAFAKLIHHFWMEIINNHDFIALLESHPWIKETENHMEEILTEPTYMSSLLIFLNGVGSHAWKKPLRLLTDKKDRLPSLDLEWLEVLLTNVFFQDEYMDQLAEPLHTLHKQLSQTGAIERRNVELHATNAMKRSLVNSTSKLTRINEIVSFEKQQLKRKLRLVILADYIYKSDLPKQFGAENPPIHRLGVIPIFESIRRHAKSDVKLGVLTGSIVILPVTSLSLLEEEAKKRKVTYQIETLIHDGNYVTIKWTATSRQKMVAVMTAVFSKGGIEVMVGTTALLGEGWDAPSINALIIASYVGTFMLSNQMRGRAIRMQKDNPYKTANIWHLVCINPHEADGGHDLQSLKRRFRSLIGLHASSEKITSGLERMALEPPPYSKIQIQDQNRNMFTRAANRQQLYKRWKHAVVKAGKKMEVMQVSQEALPRPYIFTNTLKALIIVGIMIFVSIIHGSFTAQNYNGQEFDFQLRILTGIVMGLIMSSPYFFKTLKVILRNPTLESNIRQVGKVVYLTLYQMGHIQTKWEENTMHVEKVEKGAMICWLEAGTTHEQKLFLSAIQELLDPIDNPRYLLYRRSGKHWLKRYDYHAIPEEIGRRKEYALFFTKEWQKRIDTASLIYTRTPEGREILLKARIKAMSAVFVKRSDRISIWR